MGIGKNKRLTERVLCSYRSTQSLRTSHNRRRLTIQDGLARWPRSPVNGVLQDAGDTVIVFRRRDQHRIRRADLALKRLHRFRIAPIVNVGVVWRNIPKASEHLNFHARRRQLDGGTQQPLVERSFSETAWNADDFDTHGFSTTITIRRTRRRAFLCSGGAEQPRGLPDPQTTCAL